MATKFAVDLRIGKLEEDTSVEALLYDARYFREVRCLDLDEKRAIGYIYINHCDGKIEYQPEVFNSVVKLEVCGCMEEALFAIAQAIGID